MKKIVLDASVVLKWHLPDEEYGQKAILLLTEYVAGKVEIIAPTLLQYEVMNGLIVAQRRGRVGQENITKAFEGFKNLGLNLVNVSIYSQEVFDFCRIYNISVYDGSYLALADKEGIPFVTADTRLFGVVKRDLKWVKRLDSI